MNFDFSHQRGLKRLRSRTTNCKDWSSASSSWFSVAPLPLQHPLLSPTHSVSHYFVYCCPSPESFQRAVALPETGNQETSGCVFSKPSPLVPLRKQTCSTRCGARWWHCLEALWSHKLQRPQRKEITISIAFIFLLSAVGSSCGLWLCHFEVLLTATTEADSTTCMSPSTVTYCDIMYG